MTSKLGLEGEPIPLLVFDATSLVIFGRFVTFLALKSFLTGEKVNGVTFFGLIVSFFAELVIEPMEFGNIEFMSIFDFFVVDFLLLVLGVIFLTLKKVFLDFDILLSSLF